MGEEDGVNGAARGDGNLIDDRESGLAQRLEDGDESNVDLAGGQKIGQAGGMLEDGLAVVGRDQGLRVEVLHAADAKLMEGGKRTHAQAISRGVAGGRTLRALGATRS